MWRDEYEEYLQARDAEGLFGLGNTINQGHAMLWQGCLWIITRFTHNPLAMKIFHGLIAATFAFVIVFKSPFKLWQCVMIMLSYFLLFEYAVISRCYAFGVLFFMLFALSYSAKGMLNWRIGIILFLLANTSIYAMMLTAVLAAWLFFMDLAHNRETVKIKCMKKWPILLFIGLGILMAFLQISPQPDNSFPIHRVTWPFNYYRFQVACSQFFNAFVPIPKLNHLHFWNTNILMSDNGICLWFYSILVFIITSFPFIKRVSILILWLSGVILVLFFQYHTGFYFARYYGHFFLWWLVCLWLMQTLYTPLESNRIVNILAIGSILLFQVIGGMVVYGYDWNLKFSRGGEAAHYLKAKGYSKNYMIGTVDFALSPIAGELDTKIYTMQHKELGSFTKWDTKRLNSTDSIDLVEALESGPKNDTLIFIATHPIPEFEYFKNIAEKRPIHREFIFNNYNFYCMAYFKPGIEFFEGYWLFRVNRIN